MVGKWTYINGKRFKHDLDKAALSKTSAVIEDAFKVSGLLRKKLRKEFQQCAPGLPSVAEFLGSEQVKLACAIEAAGKQNERYRPSLEKLFQIPVHLNMQKPLPEVDLVRLKRKKDGSFRCIHHFGPLHRTAKQMILRVLEVEFAARPFQHTFVGIHKAIKEVKRELAKRPHFATLDIQNHFGSFSTKKLANLLPVPKEWVDYVVGGRHAVVKIDGSGHLPSYQKSLHLAQRGLPLGSICSPIIAAYSVSKLSWSSTSESMLANYSDNFCLLAETASALEKGIDELQRSVGKLPGGKFKLAVQAQGYAADGFTFLGHRIVASDGRIEISPCEANEQAIYLEGNKMANAVSKLSKHNGGKAEYHVRRYCSRVKGWLSAFSNCSDVEEYRSTLEAQIELNAQPFEVDVAALMSTVSEEFEYSSDEYQFV